MTKKILVSLFFLFSFFPLLSQDTATETPTRVIAPAPSGKKLPFEISEKKKVKEKGFGKESRGLVSFWSTICIF